jgi:hypothetical protein
MTKPVIEATIGSYADYFSNWWGLEDGTMLEVTDPAGNMWVRAGDETMTAEEWNRRLSSD